MIAAVDSTFAPSPAQVQAARVAGVRMWNGYLQTKPNVGLYNPWTQAQLDIARAAGAKPIAYVSGWDDPVAVKAQAAAWNVLPCLDVESGIRSAVRRLLAWAKGAPTTHRAVGTGEWIQPWLDASGAGLYGNSGLHWRRAAFHVLSFWPGSDPGATWTGLRPPTPCGWQWQGGHAEFGANVDRCWFDDSFLSTFGPGGGPITGDDMTPEEHDDTVVHAFRFLQFVTGSVDPNMTETLSDGKTLVASAIDFGAPTMVDLFNSQSGPAQFPLVKTGRIDKKLDNIAAALVNPDGTSKLDSLAKQSVIGGAVIPMLQTLTDLETKVQAAVASITSIGGGLTPAQAQELTDTRDAALASAAEFKKHFTP